MKVGDYEVPENFESMSCIYNCGFVLFWERGTYTDAGNRMTELMILAHPEPQTSFWAWLRTWRRDKE